MFTDGERSGVHAIKTDQLLELASAKIEEAPVVRCQGTFYAGESLESDVIPTLKYASFSFRNTL